MNIDKFQIVDGSYIEDIKGQFRFGYARGPEFTDINDAKEIYDNEGYFIGMPLRFYDLENGEVHEPFVLQQNIAYSNVIYHQGLFYFLQADLSENRIHLISYYPGKQTEVITTMNMEDIKIEHLKLIGDGVNIVNDGVVFDSYYPHRFTMAFEDEEVLMIDEDKVYINKWTEDEHNLVIRYLDGKLLSEEVGYLQQHIDGSWWLS